MFQRLNETLRLASLESAFHLLAAHLPEADRKRLWEPVDEACLAAAGSQKEAFLALERGQSPDDLRPWECDSFQEAIRRAEEIVKGLAQTKVVHLQDYAGRT